MVADNDRLALIGRFFWNEMAILELLPLACSNRWPLIGWSRYTCSDWQFVVEAICMPSKVNCIFFFHYILDMSKKQMKLSHRFHIAPDYGLCFECLSCAIPQSW